MDGKNMGKYRKFAYYDERENEKISNLPKRNRKNFNEK